MFEVLGSRFEVSKTSNTRTLHIERIYQGDAKDTKGNSFLTAERKFSSKFYVRSSRLDNVEHRTIHRRNG